MNLDQTTAIRIAIRDTTGAIARQETPEPTRTALQAHLDALLKEELRALTGQALDDDSDESCEFDDPHAELRKTWAPGQRWQVSDLNGNGWLDMKANGIPHWYAHSQYRRHPDDTPWYPDDSGDWVEVRNDCMPCPVAEAMLIDYLLLGERTRQSHIPTPQYAGDLDWVFAASHPARIVAYKVVKP